MNEGAERGDCGVTVVGFEARPVVEALGEGTSSVKVVGAFVVCCEGEGTVPGRAGVAEAGVERDEGEASGGEELESTLVGDELEEEGLELSITLGELPRSVGLEICGEEEGLEPGGLDA